MGLKYYKDTQRHIELTSNLALRLTQPQGAPSTTDNVTQALFKAYKHPTKEEYIAIVDDETTLSIHAYVSGALQAEGDNPVKQLLLSFYGSEADAMKDIILGRPSVQLIDLLPLTWTETPKSQLDVEGWFPGDDI